MGRLGDAVMRYAKPWVRPASCCQAPQTEHTLPHHVLAVGVTLATATNVHVKGTQHNTT